MKNALLILCATLALTTTAQANAAPVIQTQQDILCFEGATRVMQDYLFSVHGEIYQLKDGLVRTRLEGPKGQSVELVMVWKERDSVGASQEMYAWSNEKGLWIVKMQEFQAGVCRLTGIDAMRVN